MHRRNERGEAEEDILLGGAGTGGSVMSFSYMERSDPPPPTPSLITNQTPHPTRRIHFDPLSPSFCLYLFLALFLSLYFPLFPSLLLIFLAFPWLFRSIDFPPVVN